MANICQVLFSGNEEMLALGLGMKGLNNSVFELVSDHLGEDEEWEGQKISKNKQV